MAERHRRTLGGKLQKRFAGSCHRFERTAPAATDERVHQLLPRGPDASRARERNSGRPGDSKEPGCRQSSYRNIATGMSGRRRNRRLPTQALSFPVYKSPHGTTTKLPKLTTSIVFTTF